jgi:hypothetical protein
MDTQKHVSRKQNVGAAGQQAALVGVFPTTNNRFRLPFSA